MFPKIVTKLFSRFNRRFSGRITTLEPILTKPERETHETADVQLQLIQDIALTSDAIDFNLGDENFYPMPSIEALEESIKSKLQVSNLKKLTHGGGYGTIFEASDESNNKYALKVIRPKWFVKLGYKTWISQGKSEVNFLRHVEHENIVQYYDHMWLPEFRCLVIKTEYLDLDLGHVMESVDCLDKHQFKRMATQVGSALDCLHRQLGTAHHDIKVINIMLKNPDAQVKSINELLNIGEWKIVDLGSMIQYPPTSSLESAVESSYREGTRGYMSMEKENVPFYNPFLADSYALGVVLVKALLGKELFHKLYYQAKRDQVPREILYITIIDQFVQQCNDDKLDVNCIEAIKGLVTNPESERWQVNKALELINA